MDIIGVKKLAKMLRDQATTHRFRIDMLNSQIKALETERTQQGALAIQCEQIAVNLEQEISK